MKQYIDLVTRILKEGGESDDRTGTGTIKIFGHQSTYNMDDGFPLLGLKNTWMKGVTHELLWLLGCHMKDDKYKDFPMTNIKYLTDNNVHIWDEWADDNGNLGPVYGKQWVDWTHSKNDEQGPVFENVEVHHNQIQTVINKLTKGHKNFNPMDRALIVSAWNVGDLDEMALRPCHAFFQFQARSLSHDERVKEEIAIRSREAGLGKFVSPGVWTTEPGPNKEALDNLKVPQYELSLQLYQRSADTFLGVPFNIASYALLLHMVCHVTGMKPGKFVHTFGDAHLYKNHRDQVNQFLHRTKMNYEGMSNMLTSDGKKVTVKELEDKTIEKEMIPDYWGNAINCLGAKEDFSYNIYEGPKLPTIELNPFVTDIFDFAYEDIKILNYNPMPTISAEVSV